MQDHQGFYWIGTEDGLNRFDGSSFRIFRNEKNSPHSLIHNFCVSLLEDNNGDIWIATFHGISVFIKKEGRFKNIILQHPNMDKNLLNQIRGMVKDSDGNIWVSSHGIWKYDWQHEKFINYYNSTNPAVANRLPVIENLNYDSLNHGIWFSTENFIFFFDMQQKQFYNSYNNPHGWKIFSQPLNSHFILDRKNQLWFFNDSTKKLSFFDIPENRITETPFRMLRGVRRLKADKENRIWISFWNGFSFIYNPVKQTTDSSLFVQQHTYSAISDQFTDFYVDNDSNYWVGSAKGISVLRPERQFYQVYPMNENIITQEQVPFTIIAVAEKNNDELFVGTTAGLYVYKLSERKYKKITPTVFNRYISSLYFSKENNLLWIGQDFRVLLYDKKGIA